LIPSSTGLSPDWADVSSRIDACSQDPQKPDQKAVCLSVNSLSRRIATDG